MGLGGVGISRRLSRPNVWAQGWRYPATSVAANYFKYIPCFWLVGKAAGVLFVSNHGENQACCHRENQNC